jgi:hypothetical protein
MCVCTYLHMWELINKNLWNFFMHFLHRFGKASSVFSKIVNTTTYVCWIFFNCYCSVLYSILPVNVALKQLIKIHMTKLVASKGRLKRA